MRLYKGKSPPNHSSIPRAAGSPLWKSPGREHICICMRVRIKRRARVPRHAYMKMLGPVVRLSFRKRHATGPSSPSSSTSSSSIFLAASFILPLVPRSRLLGVCSVDMYVCTMLDMRAALYKTCMHTYGRERAASPTCGSHPFGIGN